MTETFLPRSNMFKTSFYWSCTDENNNLICDGGPSVIWHSGVWEFIISNIGYHRLEGPATSGGMWYIHGKNITYEIKKFAKENSIDLDNLSDEDKIIIALRFS